jgi:L-ribulose-5-phosphate 3-epimerase
MRLGYNTNGFAHHDPLAAIDLLSEIGYRSIALTIDHNLLNPFSPNLDKQIDVIGERLNRYQLSSVIETGARFLLDSRVKHEPTLISPDAEARFRRIQFLKNAIDIGQGLKSGCVSLWSGVVRDGAADDVIWRRLTEALREVLEYAGEHGVLIGFEPEPGMFIDTMVHYAELISQADSAALKLTLDVGHLHCQGELPIEKHIHDWRDRLVNVHIEDMRRGVHEHLMFGEGEMDFPLIIESLQKSGYAGGVHVELSRHSHDAPNAAQKAFEYLRPFCQQTRD